MATPEAALVAALSAEVTLSAAGGRVFVMGTRQGAAMPYITVTRVSWDGEPHLEGPSTLDHPEFQIDVWAKEALASLNLAEAVRTFLDHQQRTGAGLTFYATLQDQRGPTLDVETRNFGCSLDFKIWFERN